MLSKRQGKRFLPVLQNSQEKNFSESIFHKVTGLYPLVLLTEKSMMQVFSDEYCKIFKTFFYMTPPGDYFCSTEKYLTNKIVKGLLRK